VAVYAVDLLRRTALSQSGRRGRAILSSARRTPPDVVLADGDCLPGETRPVVTLGGAIMI